MSSLWHVSPDVVMTTMGTWVLVSRLRCRHHPRSWTPDPQCTASSSPAGSSDASVGPRGREDSWSFVGNSELRNWVTCFTFVHKKIFTNCTAKRRERERGNLSAAYVYCSAGCPLPRNTFHFHYLVPYGPECYPYWLHPICRAQIGCVKKLCGEQTKEDILLLRCFPIWMRATTLYAANSQMLLCLHGPHNYICT